MPRSFGTWTERCAECGAPFEVTSSLKGGALPIYCSDACRRKVRREYREIREEVAREWRSKHNPPQGPRITEKMREAGELYESGMTQQEIADRLGVSQPAVCRRIHDYMTRVKEFKRVESERLRAEEEARARAEWEKAYKVWRVEIAKATADLPIAALKRVKNLDLNIRNMPQSREEWDAIIASLDNAIKDVRRVRRNVAKLRDRYQKASEDPRSSEKN